MLKLPLTQMLRYSLANQLLRSQTRLLHLGEANVLSSEIDKQSVEFKVNIENIIKIYINPIL